MPNLFEAIQSTVRERSTAYPLPPFLNKAQNLLENGHLYWRTFQDYKIFKKAEARPLDKGHPAVYGVALHCLSGYSSSVAYFTKVLLIAKCAEDLIHQHCKVYKAYRHLYQAVHIKYPRYYKVNWKHLNKQIQWGLSPSHHLYFYVQGVQLVKQTKKIVFCIGNLFKELFILSMRSRDVYLIAQGDEMARLHACKEFFSDWEEYQKRVTENYPILLEELKKRKQLIDRILKQGGLNQLSIDLIQSVEGWIEEAAKHLPAAVEVAKDILDPVIRPGNAGALRLGLEDEVEEPALPPGRYPPWCGEPLLGVKPLPLDNPFIQKEVIQGAHNETFLQFVSKTAHAAFQHYCISPVKPIKSMS